MSKNLEFGANGSILKSAGTLTGTYVAINAISDASITVVTNWTGADSPESISLTQGQTIYGVFTNIVWASGTVVAYE